VASKGGLVGVNGFPAFLRKLGQPSMADLIDHVDHYVDIVGSEHVAFGLDFSTKVDALIYADLVRTGFWSAADIGPPPHDYPVGLEDPSGLPNLTSALVDRGYTRDQILDMLGRNWLRVFRATWPN